MTEPVLSAIDTIIRMIGEDKRTSSFDDADMRTNLNRARCIFVAAIERDAKRSAEPIGARRQLRVVS